MKDSDTICAIATGMGQSAIGIIRISGDEAIEKADRIFRGKRKLSEMDSFTAAFGSIYDGNRKMDEVIALVMRGPHTYTTEDTVELDCHGGPLVMRRVVELLIKEGIRPAEPGEFTKRAFLGGRIDMTEAEAVMDVISAENDMALASSLEQLSGSLRDKTVSLRDRILHETAFIESAIDDPENYSLDGYSEKLDEIIEGLNEEINALISTGDEGRIIREGIRTAIVGRPNVGKSSIMNMLTGTDRAIVTDIEGTTRDTLEEYINLGGITLKLIDTAGIRDTEDVVEKIGVDRAIESMEAADLIMLVLDSSESLTDNDKELIRRLHDRKYIILINKSDLEPKIDMSELNELCNVLLISAKSGQGLDDIRNTVREMFFKNEIDFNNQLYITNARYRAALVRAAESLGRVRESIGAGVGEDFFTIDMMAAYESLGEIIGETLEDDLADKIFREFCMGK
ncbi:MAG: tRNA uridine-5-carboxymethylaminomethyl(34) synthesis GTPase MnmE [Eubacterium sp.]|nr:tRNA uridine-5-carboxymethylaminomethyl(34) synthesis GTPase MnmE [Eubacterium sp.]